MKTALTSQMDPPKKLLDKLLYLYQSGKFDLTEQTSIDYLKHYPYSAVVYNILGAALIGRGKLDESLGSINRAIALDPGFDQAYSNRGYVLAQLGQFEAAVSSCDRAITINYNDAGAHNNKGNALRGLDLLEDASKSYQKAFQINKNHFQAYNNNGVVLQQLGRYESSIYYFKKALKINSNYISAYINLSVSLFSIEEPWLAIECLEAAFELDPKCAKVYYNLCNIYDRINQLDDLKKTIKRATTHLPESNPFLLLSMAKLAVREKSFNDAIQYIDKINIDKFTPLDNAAVAEVLGKCYEELGKYEKSYPQFEKANKEFNKLRGHNEIDSQRYFNKVLKLSKSWTDTKKLNWKSCPNFDAEISHAFMVGFPRSGTTLLDAILRSHPNISVYEEKPMIGAVERQLFDIGTYDLLNSLSNEKIVSLRKVYLDQLEIQPDYSKSAKISIDKLPLNLVKAGIINRILPESKFIFVLRHPFDCVFSCFKQNFSANDAMANFITLHQAATLYDAVMKLWFQYTDNLDINAYTIRYEDLVQDMPGTIAPLVKYLGDEWHDDMLNYKDTALSRHMINTPSHSQVIENIYSKSINKWKNYKDPMNTVTSVLAPWAEKFGYSTSFD
jgi:tetratricopeptide (TPR) repeat protein